jgi:aminoglycoside 6'-N-acetyltransferase I
VSTEIRLLGHGDDDVLSRVADGVFDHAIDPRLAREFLADPRHHLFVAIDDGVVVGMITAVDYVHPDKPRQLWINEVGVAPTHQRRGIARGLLDAMLAHGREAGCTEAWLGTEDVNAAANALYRAAGGKAEPFVLYSWGLEPDGAEGGR